MKKYPSNLKNRRDFVKQSGLAAMGLMTLPSLLGSFRFAASPDVPHFGPAANYTPRIRTAFIRREENYGMRWPGEIYDGEAARKAYIEKIQVAAKELGIQADISSKPIYSLEEGEKWIQAAFDAKTDGLLLVTLDRQEHTWPTVGKAIGHKLPVVVFSPLGSSFTTNTSLYNKKEGAFIASTDDFRQAEFGMKMLKAGAKIRETRYLVIIDGIDEVSEISLEHFGTRLRFVPASHFIDQYQGLMDSKEARELARTCMNHARHIHDVSEEDVINGARSYYAVTRLLEREKADAVTMDCLGVLGPLKISLPCLAWSKLNDSGIPAACEGDLEACLTHCVVQYLFDKPAFQQDPVAETAKGCLIGSHCSCPTKLAGLDTEPEPYSIMHHHGKRDATLKPEWKVGQAVTVADLILPVKQNSLREPRVDYTAGKPIMLISTGEVVEQKSIPPSGGCVVAPMVKLHGVDSYLDYPGFHQMFFYGNHKQELKYFSQLFGITPEVI
ncbi:MAG: hypothetical protein AMS26_12195 [Bacteroides sp. SM23_62]|nr:MAG: hypothetical protein AMS26_12195 [Bacteroides sp. SM23_62]